MKKNFYCFMMRIMEKKRSFYYKTRQQVLDSWWHRANTIIFYFDLIEHYIKTHKIKNFKIEYTKEKRWRFDITCRWWDDTIFDMVYNLERATEHICIKCWSPGKLRWNIWWVLPLCTYHYILNRIQFYINKIKRWLI